MRRIQKLIVVLSLAWSIAGCGDKQNSEPTQFPAAGSADSTGSVGDAADGGGVDGTEDSKSSDAGDGADGSEGSSTVEARLRLQTALGGGLSDADVSYGDRSVQTDSSGEATIPVEAGSPFTFTVSKSGYADHVLLGRAGGESFRYITFAASEQVTSSVYSGVGVEVDSSKAILVVGVDTPDLRPLVGAEVTIDTSHDQPITLSMQGADPDNRIDDGEQGFVSFPNVSPGEVSVSIQPPNGETCEVYPGGPPRPEISAGAGEVTVMSFTCK